jgi:divalent metal cation (Fe/Co/Zn/Cd) transporter
MTEPTTPDADAHTAQPAGDDQAYYQHEYGHGRMPFFMKIVWVGFLAFATWYIVTYLLESLAQELG